MKIKGTLFLGCIFILSCNRQSHSDKPYGSGSPDTYRLHLNPAPGSKYYYDISNESETKMEVDDKKITYLNKSDVGTTYTVGKDSVGDFILSVTYNKIRLYSKNGDTETDLDADNAQNSIDPTERMLGTLKAANIIATISPKGEVKAMKGYKELSDKILAQFNPSDVAAKAVAQKQWDQIIGQGVIQKDMDQLFRVFPDSAVHIGDTWTLNYKEKGQFGLNVKAVYTLESVDNERAVIQFDGEMKSDSSSTNMMGYNATSSLEGHQEGQYEVSVLTGMLKQCSLTSKIEGTIQMMSREIPIKINATVKMTGRVVN